MKMRTEYTCPLEFGHDMIKGKWKPIILWRLRLEATSLAKLERDIWENKCPFGMENGVGFFTLEDE